MQNSSDIIFFVLNTSDQHFKGNIFVKGRNED